MDILHYKFPEEEFKLFEEKLNEIDKLDNGITKELEELEEKSIIVIHQIIFFKKKEIDLKKIKPQKINQLINHLSELSLKSETIQATFRRLKSSFKDMDDYEKKIVAYLQKELKNLFSIVFIAHQKSIEIKELFTIAQVEELVEDIQELDSYLEQIRKFIRQISHYSDFWHKRNPHSTYIDAKVVIKTNQYKADTKKYNHYKKNILDVENKIETWVDFEKKLHEPIKKGKYGGKLHARVSGNLRIIYAWDGSKKILIYENIVTKNEFDQTAK